MTRISVQDGHEVTEITTKRIPAWCRVYAAGEFGIEEDEIKLDNGVKVIRLSDKYRFPDFINDKYRFHKGLDLALVLEKPNVILMHDPQAKDLLTVAQYKKEHPEVRFYVDCHTDYCNSAQNWFSKAILHKIAYRKWIKKALPYIDQVFYISEDCKEFVQDMYQLPDHKLEFLPLGGIILDEDEKRKAREKICRQNGIKPNSIIMLHSGKMGKLKKTLDIMEAMRNIPSDGLSLLIIGEFSLEIKDEALQYIHEDSRIKFLGWKDSQELLDYLCAADIYLQPGTQSATMQQAMCCGCPVVLHPYKSHEKYLKGNGYFVESIKDIANVLNDIVEHPQKLGEMSAASYKIARDLLDYRKLTARLYSNVEQAD